MIYLDSAATSYYRPREVAQAVYDAILTMGNAGRGSHTSSLNSARMIYETRCLLNELFHGQDRSRWCLPVMLRKLLILQFRG